MHPWREDSGAGGGLGRGIRARAQTPPARTLPPRRRRCSLRQAMLMWWIVDSVGLSLSRSVFLCLRLLSLSLLSLSLSSLSLSLSHTLSLTLSLGRIHHFTVIPHSIQRPLLPAASGRSASRRARAARGRRGNGTEAAGPAAAAATTAAADAPPAATRRDPHGAGRGRATALCVRVCVSEPVRRRHRVQNSRSPIAGVPSPQASSE